MTKRIPIATAKAVAEKHDLRQVLLIGFDGSLAHVVTYGKTKEDCAAAAKAQDFWTGRIREFSFNGATSESAAVAEVRRELLERLCRCLAFHAVETELTTKFMEPLPPEYADKVVEAKRLIAEAGFDIDTLYPVSDRPTAVEAGAAAMI